LLGVFLTLALTSVVALAALSALSADASRTRPGLPLYFNTSPRNVHDLAQAAVRRLAQGPDPGAARELSRLGGAALPHVLPNLDALPPSARGRVAQALAPVARRMGVGGDEDLNAAETAITFWERFWQDRSFDFRPQVVRRMVGRLAQRSNALRVEDIVHLDTYSLSELVPALGRVRDREDVLRAERLTLVLSHVTGLGPRVERDMSPAEARAVVRKWQNFWLAEGPDYLTLDGPRRVVATFAQTRYGTWILHELGVLRNPAANGEGSLGIPLRLTLASAARLVASIVLALLIGVLWTRLELGGTRRLRFAATLLVALPTPFVALGAGGPSAALSGVLAVLLTGVLGAAILSRHALSTWNSADFAASPRPFALLATLTCATPSCLPWLLTSAFGLELVLGLEGAARAVQRSLAEGDVAGGMSLSLGGSLLAVCLVTLAGRAADRAPALGLRAPALIEVGGASSRRLWLLGTGTLFVLGLFGGGWSQGSGNAGGWSAVADGARSVLGYGTVTLVVSTLVGLALGAAAASGPTAIDGLFIRALEVGGGLPSVLWAAALTRVLGPGFALALSLGLLRAVDVAWLLRGELLRRGSSDQDQGTRSLGHLPLSVYLRRRLGPAALPALSAAALTPAWLLAVSVAGRLAALPANAGAPGWGLVLSRPHASGVLPCLAAVGMLALLTGLLLAVATSAPRRVGAARSNPPPADGAIGLDE
jgi:hypothetical protein